MTRLPNYLPRNGEHSYCHWILHFAYQCGCIEWNINYNAIIYSLKSTAFNVLLPAIIGICAGWWPNSVGDFVKWFFFYAIDSDEINVVVSVLMRSVFIGMVFRVFGNHHIMGQLCFTSSAPWTLNILVIDADVQCSMFTCSESKIFCNNHYAYMEASVSGFFFYFVVPFEMPSTSNITKIIL